MVTTDSSRIDAAIFPEIDDLPVISKMPDPLVFRGDTPVASLDEWENLRKPELKALFQHYMYGFAPAPPPIRATVRSVDETVFGGAAIMKQVAITFGPEGTPPIELLLFLPKLEAGTLPPSVFLGLNFGGNHTVLADSSIALPSGAAEADRGKAVVDWSIEQTIARGYAVATFYSADVAPDRPDFNGGVFPFFDDAGQERPDDAWGILAAWAWGLQRAVDYLVTDGDIDPSRIVLFGHSRNGKAALLSAAFDERVSAVIAHQAGCGGSGPSRSESPDAETVAIITKAFPCWFAANFARFADRVDRLPFDQNCLAALCAPRPVLFSAGSRDLWANPEGQRQVLVSAADTYKLYAADEGLADLSGEPALDRLIGGRLAYCVCDTKHGVDAGYWALFADFADLRRPQKRSAGLG